MAWRKNFAKIFSYWRGERLSLHVQTVPTSLMSRLVKGSKIIPKSHSLCLINSESYSVTHTFEFLNQLYIIHETLEETFFILSLFNHFRSLNKK